MAEPIKTDITKDPDWWATWFEADFSWDGLAKLKDDGTPVHPWKGWVVVDEARCFPEDEATSDDPKRTRPATLQDYWRADPQDNWGLRDPALLLDPEGDDPTSELIGGNNTPDGRVWHIAHLPPARRDGTNPGWKADLKDRRWAVLQRLLQARMDAAAETQLEYGRVVKGADRRAQLTGCVLGEATPAPQDAASLRHVGLDRSAHLGRCGYRESKWGAGAGFQSARFLGTADFTSARFSGNADFQSASVSGNAYFPSASFSGNADFMGASFSGNANFQSASFSGDADFISASFSGYADFESASFSEYADFQSASFSGNADFESASFSEYANFKSASFLRSLKLQRGTAPAQPAGQIYRVGADGHNPASLTRGEKDRLDEGDFALTLTTGAARREMGAFSGFYFNDALCLGPVQFNDRGFGQAPDFSMTRFYDRAEFHRADMHEGARFFKAKFRLDSECPPLEWEALAADLCERHKLGLQPSQDVWVDWTLAWRAAQRAAEEFKDARSILVDARSDDDTEAIKNSQHALFSAERVKNLVEAHSVVRARLVDESHPKGPFWRAAYAAWHDYWTSACAVPEPERVPLFSLVTLRRLPGRLWVRVNPDARKPRHRHLRDADMHEAAYRRLKLIMRQIGSHIEEQRFFALELKARQKRDDVAVWERWAAAAYGGLADYGRSAVRPLYWLAGVWAAFAVSYALLAAGAGVLPEMAERPEPAPEQGWVVDRPFPLAQIRENREALGQQTGATLGSALTRISGPFVFAFEITVVPVANPVGNHTWSEALNDKDGYSTAFSLMRLLNRMFAVPLLFLFVLSLRRRFQIG